MTQNGKELKYASERLKDDYDVVLAAVTQNGSVFKYVSNRLQNNEDIILASMTQNGDTTIKYLDANRVYDDEILYAIIQLILNS